MKLTKTVFIVLLLETLIVFGLCVGAGFIFSEDPDWAFINPMIYKFQTGLLYFFNLLPAIFITGIMVGYSWGFGKKKVNPTHRFSEIFVVYLKNVLITSLICTSLCFIAAEVGIPLISYSRTNMEENSKNTAEYIGLAKKNLAIGDYGTALFYANYVLDLSPDSAEAMELVRFIEENQFLQRQDKIAKEKSENTSIITSKTAFMTIPELMQNAMDCYASKDYFNAHYYASLVLEISKSRDGNLASAKQLASDAWNKLTEIDAFENDLSGQVFHRKKEGYTALTSGDYSKAYYIFYELLEKYPLDYDIKNFYEISKELLSTRYFFIDETLDNLKSLEMYFLHFLV